MSQQQLPKGYNTEELLRSYFLKIGYFVVRGVPFSYQGFEVTDIDIWLYGRTSSFSREIVIVDSKNKKTPQAMERIFWVQGLRVATRATSAMVATTDRRSEVKKFGKQLGVTVLDGSFLGRLAKNDGINTERLTDEEFVAMISAYEFSKLDGDWKARIKYSKGLLASPLSFDSCNIWLEQIQFFAHHAITNGKHREIAMRCVYLLCSFVAIGIDFLMKEISFLEQPERSKLIKDGFTYGTRGYDGITNTMNLAVGLIENYAVEGKAVVNQIRKGFNERLDQLRTEILGEFFSRNEVARSLFVVAREFEKMAMSKVFFDHRIASFEVRGMLFCLLDFLDVSRTMFSG